jgi:hypothetical protein
MAENVGNWKIDRLKSLVKSRQVVKSPEKNGYITHFGQGAIPFGSPWR